MRRIVAAALALCQLAAESASAAIVRSVYDVTLENTIYVLSTPGNPIVIQIFSSDSLAAAYVLGPAFLIEDSPGSLLALPLAEGDPIGPDQDAVFDASLRGGEIGAAVLWEVVPAGTSGLFADVGEQFVGLRFSTESAPEEFYYGWLAVNLTTAPGTESSLALHVSEMAYQDTPGVAIFAGQIPEPATGTLFGFGLLLLGVRRGRA